MAVVLVAELIRLPCNADAFEEARGPFKRSWSHPAVLNARMETCGSVSAFLRAPKAKVYDDFCRVYERFCIDALRGRPLPHRAYQHADGDAVMSRPAQPVDGAAMLANLKQQLTQEGKQ